MYYVLYIYKILIIYSKSTECYKCKYNNNTVNTFTITYCHPKKYLPQFTVKRHFHILRNVLFNWDDLTI